MQCNSKAVWVGIIGGEMAIWIFSSLKEDKVMLSNAVYQQHEVEETRKVCPFF